MTIIFTTKDVKEAETEASRIGVLSNGRLGTIDAPENIKRRYGVGYNLIIAQLITTSDFEKVIDDIILQSDIQNCVKTSSKEQKLVYQVPQD